MSDPTRSTLDALAAVLPGKLRVMLQSRPPRSDARKAYYTFLSGHSFTVDVRTPTEAAALWKGIQAFVASGAWHDGKSPGTRRARPAPAAVDAGEVEVAPE